MIHLEKINKSYVVGGRPLHVLRDIDLRVASGELVSVMGSSGSGKSTLLNIIGLLDAHDSGTYSLGGEPMFELAPKDAARIRNRQIGFIFQSFNLLPFKTAAENVALPLYYQAVPRRERLLTARHYLDAVGLADRADHRPGQLSGGEQQRVAIARALVTNPRLILADEPTGALDSANSAQVMDLLERVNGDGITVLVVTHEIEISERTHRTIRLRDGRVEV